MTAPFQQADAISIHALCEEGDRLSLSVMTRFYAISIHALCEEGDTSAVSEALSPCIRISIHALREEGDAAAGARIASCRSFLSTPSARRATWHVATLQRSRAYFYPRPPRGGRPLMRSSCAR